VDLAVCGFESSASIGASLGAILGLSFDKTKGDAGLGSSFDTSFSGALVGSGEEGAGGSKAGVGFLAGLLEPIRIFGILFSSSHAFAFEARVSVSSQRAASCLLSPARK